MLFKKRKIGADKVSLRHVIIFRIYLYISAGLTSFVGIIAFDDFTKSSSGGLAELVLLLIIALPTSAVPAWYFKIKKNTAWFFAVIPPLAFIPCLLLIRQLIKKDHNVAAPDHGEAVFDTTSEDEDAAFDTDTPFEEKKAKHYDLWKLDHAIAFMVAGVWVLVGVYIIYLGILILRAILLFLYMIFFNPNPNSF